MLEYTNYLYFFASAICGFIIGRITISNLETKLADSVYSGKKVFIIVDKEGVMFTLENNKIVPKHIDVDEIDIVEKEA